MKIVALYKTFDGGVFVDASLASIYDHVDAIVMVHSDVSWLGERGNTVVGPAIEWCECHDKAGKVHHVKSLVAAQEYQYSAGIDYINHHKLGDIIMVVDADEVWEARYIENAKRFIHDRPAAAYRCSMHTYLKAPFYQVQPAYGSPIAFLRDYQHLTTSPRGCKAPAIHVPECWMHHYTYVRETRADVERKTRQSAWADKSGETIVPGWMESVYDRMPEGQNLHAFEKHMAKWKRIRKVWLPDMPPAMRTAKNLGLWLPGGIGETMIEGEINSLQRLAAGRNQAVDLGTYRGLSAVALSIACKQVHTIDCYRDLPADSFADVKEPDQYQRFTHTLAENQERFQRFGNITCEAGLTDTAAIAWDGPCVDFLFVDADHSEAGTLANVNAWLWNMRRGALVVLHDNNDLHPGVQVAVDKMRNDPRFRPVDPGEYAGSLAAFEVA